MRDPHREHSVIPETTSSVLLIIRVRAGTVISLGAVATGMRLRTRYALVLLVIMAVLGGTGSLFGPILGAGLYLYVENIVSGFGTIGEFWHLILGVVFVVAVVLFPDGIWGGINYIRDMVVGGEDE